jgi:hypothetical protein
MNTDHDHLPYNDAYATCERTVAELRIYGDRLNPAEVTDVLGILPTSLQVKGEITMNSVGGQRKAPTGGWFLSSEQQVESLDLRQHIDWLLDLLLARANVLRSIQGRDGFHMNVTCIWWSRLGDGGPTLCPEHMSGLAELNLECRFEIAFYGDTK